MYQSPHGAGPSSVHKQRKKFHGRSPPRCVPSSLPLAPQQFWPVLYQWNSSPALVGRDCEQPFHPSCRCRSPRAGKRADTVHGMWARTHYPISQNVREMCVCLMMRGQVKRYRIIGKAYYFIRLRDYLVCMTLRKKMGQSSMKWERE